MLKLERVHVVWVDDTVATTMACLHVLSYLNSKSPSVVCKEEQQDL
jgi:hypothetical protein